MSIVIACNWAAVQQCAMNMVIQIDIMLEVLHEKA